MIKYVRSMLFIPILLVAAACSTSDNTMSGSASSTSAASSSENSKLDKDARAALQQLLSTNPKATEINDKAVAILVFPDILKAGLIVGAQGGNGVLLSRDGKTLGYYNATALSYGLQAGAQSFGESLFFMSDSALAYLYKSDGWSVGVGPSVVVMDAGTAKSMTTTTLKSDIYAFIFDQKGLMAGLGLQGQKITRLNR
ncbi:lipid-binding SYLF domain-containing protein [Cupriavidus basilensis]|uniref:Lipid-binding SYLF domain-containing protein n=1 Tax=Cupriavidus basilensis TaxID=68895 RepID=A0ABT6AI95_9BURK|nr:lipid-binding SYLF domain-containing protein [Cupriavidus basilensis]MDF3832320.1 lipid-binding SYLF domain-containing protein [Cupriavidus basilensis]